MDIDAYLKQHQHKTLLRFITCGSVDDGKSTLIGRLLYDSKTILEDQLGQLEADSKRSGTQGENIDFALLVDGLAAEREQGITIDVAYRFFSTEKRKFIVADTPGHEQYTRNMVTGASTSELAVILVDAQRAPHSDKAAQLYCKVDWYPERHPWGQQDGLHRISPAQYEAILKDYRDFSLKVGISHFVAIPISRLTGGMSLAVPPRCHGPKGFR